MVLQTMSGNITISSNSLKICCRAKDLKNVFQEFFKLIPKETKIKDIKKIITKKISLI